MIRNIGVDTLGIAMLALTGCVGSKVGWIEDESPLSGSAHGNYAISAANINASALDGGCYFEELTSELARKSGDSKVKVPVRVYAEDSYARDVSGTGVAINNLLSVCTLGVWPYVKTYEYSANVKVASPTDSQSRTIRFGEREWSSFILPIAAIPCPGFGDWRGSLSESRKGFINDCERKALSGMLNEDFYAKSAAEYSTFLARISQAVEDSAEIGVGDDSRPIFLLDPKDVYVRCKGEGVDVDVDGVMDLMEDCLRETDLCRIISKKSVERSITEQALLAILTGQGDGLADIKVPAYRVEISIERYAFNSETKQVSKTKKHTFKKKSVWSGVQTTVNADVNMVIKVSDLKTGELVFSENMSGECSDISADSTFSGRKGSESVAGKMLSTEEHYMHKAIEKIMESFADKVKDMQKFHIVACSDNGVLTIDATDHIFKPGEKARLFQLGEPKVSKRTGRTTRSESEIAVVNIVNSSSSGSDARIESISDINFSGDVIVRKMKAGK